MKDKIKKYQSPVIEVIAIDYDKSIAVSGTQGAGLWEEYEG